MMTSAHASERLAKPLEGEIESFVLLTLQSNCFKEWKMWQNKEKEYDTLMSRCILPMLCRYPKPCEEGSRV